MSKFYGFVGYASTIETSPGVWEEKIVEHPYRGDIIKNTRRLESGESINDNITISNQISIVADPYAYHNIMSIRYVKWMGALWKVTTVDVQRPRLILTLGGVYNGSTGWVTRAAV